MEAAIAAHQEKVLARTGRDVIATAHLDKNARESLNANVVSTSHIKKIITTGQRGVVAESRVNELETMLADETLYQGDAEGAKRAAGLGRDLAAARAAREEALREWEESEGETGGSRYAVGGWR
jgi:hypothetical protein